jgi:small conductance mechanosensitive channel
MTIDAVQRFLIWFPDNLARPARILVVLLLAAVALRLIHRFIPKLRDLIAARQDSREDSQRVLTLSQVVRYGLTVTVTVLTGLVLLSEFGISVAPILGAAGVVGIALGFGAQSLVKDYFTGFFLLLENQIRIGDVVEAGGKTGLVEELTLRYLRLRDYSGKVHYIPNGQVSVVTNMSLGFACAVIDARVAYGTDVDQAIAVMRSVAEALRSDQNFSQHILADFEMAGVDRWDDSAIVIRARFRVRPLEQWTVRREYLRRLKPAFEDAGIEIPFLQVKLSTRAAEDDAASA